MDKAEEILKSEYSEQFDQLRKHRIVVSFYKYGPVKENYSNKLIDALKSLENCIKKYDATGNTEYLVDAANYCMFEFMFPQHPKAHFGATDSKESAGIVGMSIKEIERYKEGDTG